MSQHGITSKERRALILLFALLVLASLVLYCSRRDVTEAPAGESVAVPAVTLTPAAENDSVKAGKRRRSSRKKEKRPFEQKKPLPTRDPRGDVVN